jgi:hypothetical protein
MLLILLSVLCHSVTTENIMNNKFRSCIISPALPPKKAWPFLSRHIGSTKSLKNRTEPNFGSPNYIAPATAPIVEVSYASCYAIALRLALKPLSPGVQANSVVPIISVHPVDIAISMIAILLAGSAYAIMDLKASKR